MDGFAAGRISDIGCEPHRTIAKQKLKAPYRLPPDDAPAFMNQYS